MEDTPTPIAEIDHGPSKFEQFLDEHQKKLIVLAIAVFLGVLAYVFFSGYGEMKNQHASAKLQSGDLQGTIQEYPDTPASAAAGLELADQKSLNSQKEAIEDLQAFIAKHPDYPAAPTAQVSLGLRLLDEGKTSEAEAHLNSVLEVAGAEYIAPLAKLALGDIALKSGNKEKAKTLYTEVSKLDQNSSPDSIQTYRGYVELAKSRLFLIDAKAPREVEPKPAAKPAPAVAPGATEGEQPATPALGPATQPEQTETPADAQTPAAPAENGSSEENQEKNSQE